MQFEGKTVVVTGATGGIGERYVHAFAAAGANVVATDVPTVTDPGAELAEKTGAVFVAGDVTSDDDWAAVEAQAAGRVDVLVNNAAIDQGLCAKRPLTELSADDCGTVLRAHVRVWGQRIK